MRFGIMELQMALLVPTGVPAETLLQHVVHFDHAELTRRVAQSGLKTIELGGDLVLFFPSAYSPDQIERLAALKSELNLGYTLHLPLWSVELSTPLTSVRLGSVKAIVDVINATRILDPEDYVLHATGSLAAEFYRMSLPDQAHALILRQFQSAALDSIRRILGETGLPSRKLAVETIEFPSDLTLELAEALDLSLCLDTGHVLSGFSGNIDLNMALERCLPRLAQIHLHDAPRWNPSTPITYGKDHQQLGRGDLQVGPILDRLALAGFQGPLIFELGIDEALNSLETIRRTRPALPIA